MNKERTKYLESLVPKDVDINKLYFDNFSKYARYLGNGIYEYLGCMSTDTRELFLMTSLHKLGIIYKEV
jgi:hypothetical protein